VRRFWEKADDELGMLVHRHDGNWTFSYRLDEDDELIFEFDCHTLMVGEYVTVTEHDGVPRPPALARYACRGARRAHRLSPGPNPRRDRRDVARRIGRNPALHRHASSSQSSKTNTPQLASWKCRSTDIRWESLIVAALEGS